MGSHTTKISNLSSKNIHNTGLLKNSIRRPVLPGETLIFRTPVISHISTKSERYVFLPDPLINHRINGVIITDGLKFEIEYNTQTQITYVKVTDE